MIQNRDKEGTISLILNSVSSANHYILFSSSIDRCKNTSISKDAQKTKGNGVTLKVGKIGVPNR